MRIEEQVTNLELSKKLKELGVKQEGIFMWYVDQIFYPDKTVKETWEIFQASRMIGNTWIPKYSAFTVAELGQYLPPRIQFKNKVKKNPDWSIDFIPDDELEELKHAGFLNISNPNRWCVNYLSNACFGIQNMAEVFRDDTNLANAMAKCVIYLIENNLLKDKTNIT